MALSRIQLQQLATTIQNPLSRVPKSFGSGPFEGHVKQEDRQYSVHTGNPIPKNVEEVQGRSQPVMRAKSKTRELSSGR